MSTRLPLRRLHTPVITDADRAAVERVLRDVETGASVVRALEAALCSLTGFDNAVACASGTAGLTAAWNALGCPTVTAPVLTFAATWNAVRHDVGLRDVSPKTWMLDGSRLRGSIAVELNAAVIDPAEARDNPPLIYDSACALRDGLADGRDPRSITVVSFNSSKTITGLGGGAVLTDDTGLAERVRQIIDQGKIAGDATEPGLPIGFNGRISYPSAALVLSQLARFSEIAAHKRALIQAYYTGLHRADVTWQQAALGVPWLAMPKFPRASQAKAALAALNACNVQARRMYQIPSHVRLQDFPVASELAATVLQLPMGLDLTVDDVREICGIVLEAVR